MSSVNDFTATNMGRTQPTSYRDVRYGVLFLAKLAVVAVVGAQYGPDALADLDDNAHTLLAYRYVLALVALALALAGMMARSQRLVSAALSLAIGVSFIWETIRIGPSPIRLVLASGIVLLVLMVGYAFVV